MSEKIEKKIETAKSMQKMNGLRKMHGVLQRQHHYCPYVLGLQFVFLCH